MGNLFDKTFVRTPLVPESDGMILEYVCKKNGWSTQSKRIKKCCVSLELLYKDVYHLNLLLSFLKSTNNDDIILHARLFTCLDVDSKLSKILWKMGNNTLIRIDLCKFIPINKFNENDKSLIMNPEYHLTPKSNENNNNINENSGNNVVHSNANVNESKVNNSVKYIKKGNIKPNNNDNNGKRGKKGKHHERNVLESYILTVHEFYYLFLFFEDKLPELSEWLMTANDKYMDNNKANMKSIDKLSQQIKMFNNKIKDKNNNNSHNIDDNTSLNDINDDSNNEIKQEILNDSNLFDDIDRNNDSNIDNNTGSIYNESIVSDELESNTCIICFLELQDPVVLSCTHEYCKECIKDWQSQSGSNGQECPVCRCRIAQSEIWITLDNDQLKHDQQQYIKKLLDFPFDYVKLFPKWKPKKNHKIKSPKNNYNNNNNDISL